MTKFGRAVFASILLLVSLALITLLLMLFADQHTVEGDSSALTLYETSSDQQRTILVDDFISRSIQGHPCYLHNRLGGDRRPIHCTHPPSVTVTWGRGLVTATIISGTNTCAGVWTSLNHPLPDCTPLNFSSIFPSQITTTFQGSIGSLANDLQIQISDGWGTFQVELLRGDSISCAPPQTGIWSETVTLSGGPQVLSFDLPPDLTETHNLNWVVTGNVGSFVAVDRVELTATVPQLDTPKRAFLWSYAMLLNNWDPESGLTRDHACYKANQFDNISASGIQAAAAVMASRLGFISEISATEIVSKTTQGLLDLPRDDKCGNGGSGLWPHFVDHGQIVSGTEWSSIDTVIAAVTLIEAREALGLETKEVEAVLDGINWNTLILTDGHISHGYWSDCQPIVWSWDSFGLESWVVNLGYAAATGKVAEFDHEPPTWNGGGFCDELAWLLMPPCCRDQWETKWCDYSQQAVNRQLAYYRCEEAEAPGCWGCCGDNRQCWEQDAKEGCSCCRDHPCYGPLGLFGLTPNEVPDLSAIPPTATRTYLDFGVCGKASCIDGTDPVTIPGITSTVVVSLGHAVIVPHYAGIIASLRPTRAISLWNWLEAEGLFTPLNNAESFMFTDELTSTDGLTCTQIVWNERKGSWEIGLQTLGWGRLLAEDNNPLYQGFLANDMLRRGYMIMCPPRIFLPIILKEYQ